LRSPEFAGEGRRFELGEANGDRLCQAKATHIRKANLLMYATTALFVVSVGARAAGEHLLLQGEWVS